MSSSAFKVKCSFILWKSTSSGSKICRSVGFIWFVCLNLLFIFLFIFLLAATKFFEIYFLHLRGHQITMTNINIIEDKSRIFLKYKYIFHLNTFFINCCGKSSVFRNLHLSVRPSIRPSLRPSVCLFGFYCFFVFIQ